MNIYALNICFKYVWAIEVVWKKKILTYKKHIFIKKILTYKKHIPYVWFSSVLIMYYI